MRRWIATAGLGLALVITVLPGGTRDTSLSSWWQLRIS